MQNQQSAIKNQKSKTPSARLVVLVSGSGSNLQAILDACASGELNAQVVVVISNKPDVFSLERARRANVPAITKQKSREQDRRQYDAELANLVASYEPDWVILAGWMRLLSSTFLDRFSTSPNTLPLTDDASSSINPTLSPPTSRVINLHPALPNTFPGARAVERAYEAFQRGEITHTGIMVHLVPDEGVDSGPVLAQEIVPIHPSDTPETLETRIHQAEHKLLVATIQKLTTGPKLQVASAISNL